MQPTRNARIILKTLFVLSAAGRPIARSRLCLQLRLDAGALDRALCQLGAAGLVDPRRLRLTLPGLAVAAALGASAARTERGEADRRRAA